MRAHREFAESVKTPKTWLTFSSLVFVSRSNKTSIIIITKTKLALSKRGFVIADLTMEFLLLAENTTIRQNDL